MATAEITVIATASGLPEGGVDQLEYTMSNTSAANTVQLVSLTTAIATATPVVMPSSARFVLCLPPSTNTHQWRVLHSTSDTGIIQSSHGMTVLTVAGNTTFYFCSSPGGSSFVLRVITY